MNLPANPYSRQPIKTKQQLAGRAQELKTIEYYLKLTAAGQSPHLALLGSRGVGKTSLLNGAQGLALDLKLLPVRLDMNEKKAGSPGLFWHDFYVTLLWALGKAGCWGGTQGEIYASLFRMLHSRRAPSVEAAVLQAPFAFSCHEGPHADFECPDALIINDLQESIAELQRNGMSGIALLIDEANCLGQNVPLLQMFRNIFQIVDCCSLVLAGTEAVFPALSEVFSPIPRQFHRVDVKPFARWWDTFDLVMKPLLNLDLRDIAPSTEMIRELHDLCGGDPAEVQLYCHHMYRSVEDEASTAMSLSPTVFRAVLREYRANSPADVESVLNAIERLPDNLLFQSQWLSRRNLSTVENVRVAILRGELSEDRELDQTERHKIEEIITSGYKRLFDAGITQLDNYVRLAGAPLTSGFWKSYVEAEKGKRWIWDDDSFAEHMRQPVLAAIGRASGSAAHIELRTGDESVASLSTLRSGGRISETVEGMNEMHFAAYFAKEQNCTNAADVGFQIHTPAGTQQIRVRYIEETGKATLDRSMIETWIVEHEPLLKRNDVALEVQDFIRWELPSSEELHRLGRITGAYVSDVFGPREIDQAVASFKAGDQPRCREILTRMIADKSDHELRNNLAFCQILAGEVNEGLANIDLALKDNYEPLYALNKAVAEFLAGRVEAAVAHLEEALRWIDDPKNKHEVDSLFVLLIEASRDTVTYVSEMPTAAAILINLYRIGGIEKGHLLMELQQRYAGKYLEWLPVIDRDASDASA